MTEKAINKNFLLICGVIATAMGFFSKLILRPLIHEYEINDFDFNGFAPNLFTAIGFCMFVAYSTNKKPIISMAAVTLGLLAYEIDQIWSTSRTFDYADIIATLVGFGLSVLILRSNSKKSNNQTLIQKG
jgi:glycopeptide antibiotics resistance protein